MTSSLEQLAPRVHRFVDTCAVYVITSGERALLVDLGAGGVLSRLGEVGVTDVDCVLHTHHHRDQCQGDRLLPPGVEIAVPEHEAHLFDSVDEFWQAVSTADLYDMTNHWQSLREPVPVARRLRDCETLTWGGLEFLVLPTPGHTKGSVTYVVEIDGLVWAFSGDLVHSPGRVWTIHDLQWSYLAHEGLVTALHSARALRRRAPDRLAPSHGPVALDPDSTLAALEQSLDRLWRVGAVGFSEIWDEPQPPLEPRFDEIAEHLVSVSGPVACFHVLHQDGCALFFDYGFPSWEHGPGGALRFVEHTLTELRERYGIERVEVVVPTHHHDDHVAGIPFLQAISGCEVWAYDRFAHFLERPTAYRVPCLHQEAVQITRSLSDGESFEWRGHRFEVGHNPGHDQHAALFLGVVDGVRVAVVGDEFERDRRLRLRGSAPIYRNRVATDEFAGVVATLREFAPDVLLTGHIGADRVRAGDFDDAEQWAARLEDAWRGLAALPDAVGLALDPDPVAFDPYLTVAAPGADVAVELIVRNHFAHPVDAAFAIALPADWSAHPAAGEVAVAPGAAARVPLVVHVPEGAAERRFVLAADVALGDLRLGEAGEAIVRVAPAAP